MCLGFGTISFKTNIGLKGPMVKSLMEQGIR
jgi:hypothetical protein